MSDIGSGDAAEVQGIFGEPSSPTLARPATAPVPLSLATRMVLLRGKIRRFVYGHLRKEQTRAMVARRKGECNRCGACCQILVKCAFYDECREGAECRIYDKRPVNCRVFPMDPRDIEELNLMRPDKPCGYYFE